MTSLPNDQEKKYDRQLRLWGSHGQKALHDAHVLLLNASPVGTETLKNLVLPGVGKFTVADGELVKDRDCKNSFFVTSKDIGRPRAQVVVEHLQELNPETKGEYLQEDPGHLVRDAPDFFKQFTIVIATQFRESQVRIISSLCYEHNIPLVVCRQYGLIGTIALQNGQHHVIESKPDNEYVDVRLSDPFPALVQLCDAYDSPDCLCEYDLAHTPWPILLLKYLRQWLDACVDRSVESLRRDRSLQSSFRAYVTQQTKRYQRNRNVKEMMGALYKVWERPKLPDDVAEILDDVERSSDTSTAGTDHFSLLCIALSKFIERRRSQLGAESFCWPHAGDIPDMESDTEKYIALQRVYRTQAQRDREDFVAILTDLLETRGLPETLISDEEVRRFLKNCLYLRRVALPPLASSLFQTNGTDDPEASAKSAEPNELISEMLGSFESQDEACVIDPAMRCNWICAVLLRAVDEFYERFNHYPGALAQTADNSNVAADKVQLREIWGGILSTQFGISASTAAGYCSHLHDYIVEFTRWGAGELHVIGAALGGIASQEAIKLLTHQWVPVTGVYVWNAMAGTSSRFPCDWSPM